VQDENTGQKYFVKVGSTRQYDMLKAEYIGVREMYNTKTIRVPKAIGHGSTATQAYAVFEHLNLSGSRRGGRAYEMGEKLAAMHRHTSANGCFGFDIPNTCGVTPQPNEWTESWPVFFDTYRLHNLFERLRKKRGITFAKEEEVRSKIKSVLEDHVAKHNPPASLVHGDLWTGNAGFLDTGEGCIYDPACAYCDREYDLAMTHLFGSLPRPFYEGYEKAWPLPKDGQQQRQEIYNLYHVLNHALVFGGGYVQQAEAMMDEILTY